VRKHLNGKPGGERVGRLAPSQLHDAHIGFCAVVVQECLVPAVGLDHFDRVDRLVRVARGDQPAAEFGHGTSQDKRSTSTHVLLFGTRLSNCEFVAASPRSVAGAIGRPYACRARNLTHVCGRNRIYPEGGDL
jgi:hypothetical protein